MFIDVVSAIEDFIRDHPKVVTAAVALLVTLFEAIFGALPSAVVP
jgi:hypothetical protein